MKATKALKRLAKIEASLSDLIERFSAREHRGQELLQNAKASVVRAREIVSLQASSRTAKNPHVKHGEEPPVKATSEPSKPKRKLSAAGRKAIQEALRKRWAQKRAEPAKAQPAAAKKVAIGRKKGAKKAAKRAAAKSATAPAPTTQAAG